MTVLQTCPLKLEVQGLITQKNSKALCVHCNSHALNLIVVKACRLPLVRNMAGTITEISNFFLIIHRSGKGESYMLFLSVHHLYNSRYENWQSSSRSALSCKNNQMTLLKGTT